MNRSHERATGHLSQRIQVRQGDEIALGPGKADLLEAIERTGSLAEAALSLEIPYMLALNLIQTMNAAFAEPLVELQYGGSPRGASLTEPGRQALQIYRRMQSAGEAAMEPFRQQLLSLLAHEERMPAPRRRRAISFGSSIPISMLGGLIGVGGAEYRLPVLAGPLRYSTRTAIPLNLAVSLATLLVSLFARARVVSLNVLIPIVPIIAAMIVGSVIVALAGTRLVRLFSNERLERVVLVFLVAIGVILLLESLFPLQHAAFSSSGLFVRVVLAGAAGSLIGAFSSTLGIAGGELIIPTLILIFGVDIKTAGTASLVISIPTVLAGLSRYTAEGGLSNRRDWRETLVPMIMGSVIGSILGGLLLGIVSASFLKFLLGLILISSAVGVFGRHRPLAK